MKILASVLALVMSFESVALAAPGALESEVRSLRATIDSGGSPVLEKAVDDFADRLLARQVTLGEIHQYMKERTTEREYREFRTRLDGALRGIDPSSLKPEELATLLMQSLGNTRSDGLAWSGCIGLTVGVMAIVTALIVWFTSVVKVATENEVREIAEKNRQRTNADYDRSIKDTLEWETSIPRRIRQNERDISAAESRLSSIGSDIRRAESEVESLERRLAGMADDDYSRYTVQTQLDAARSDVSSLRSERNRLPGQISDYQADIRRLQALFAKYTANPNLAIEDAAATEARRQPALDRITQEEEADVTAIPGELARQRANQRRNRTWAAVGAAIGGYFLADGIVDEVRGRDNACNW